MKINKFNQIGEKLLGFKIEFQKDHPEIIKDAILVNLDVLKNKGEVFDKEIELIKNSNYDINQFKIHIQKNPKYLKTEAELKNELDKIVLEINSLINQLGYKDLIVEYDVKNWNFIIKKKYGMSYTYIKSFLGINDEDLNKLINNSKVITGFTVLRLTKIFNDIKNAIPKNNYIYNTFSTPTLNKDNKEAASYFQYIVDIDLLSGEKLNSIIGLIIDLSKIVDKTFEDSLGDSKGINKIEFKIIEDRLANFNSYDDLNSTKEVIEKETTYKQEDIEDNLKNQQSESIKELSSDNEETRKKLENKIKEVKNKIKDKEETKDLSKQVETKEKVDNIDRDEEEKLNNLNSLRNDTLSNIDDMDLEEEDILGVPTNIDDIDANDVDFDDFLSFDENQINLLGIDEEDLDPMI